MDEQSDVTWRSFSLSRNVVKWLWEWEVDCGARLDPDPTFILCVHNHQALSTAHASIVSFKLQLIHSKHFKQYVYNTSLGNKQRPSFTTNLCKREMFLVVSCPPELKRTLEHQQF